MIPVDQKGMLRHLSEILKADLGPDVLEDPSKLRLDHVGLCDLILDLFQWHLQQTPDENASKHRGLVNAWIAVLRVMAKVLLALQVAVGLNVDAVRPLIPKIKSLQPTADMKEATDELVSALQTICLGSASASRAISHWEGMIAASKKSLKSEYGSEPEVINFDDSDSQPGVGITSNGTTFIKNGAIAGVPFQTGVPVMHHNVYHAGQADSNEVYLTRR